MCYFEIKLSVRIGEVEEVRISSIYFLDKFLLFLRTEKDQGIVITLITGYNNFNYTNLL